MHNRITSLVTLIAAFIGPIACSDAGDTQADSRGRDSQALSASGDTRDAVVESSPAASFTIGTAGSGGSTLGIELSPGATVEPAITSVIQNETAIVGTLTPGATVSGGPLVVDDVEEGELSGTISWGDADAGVEVHLGGSLDDACASLRSACLAAGESESSCDDLVEQCEEAIANPAPETDVIGFVSDCDEMGASCRAAGVPEEECEQAVAVCRNQDAGTEPPPAMIVTDCDDLRDSCAAAGRSEQECDGVVEACENPAPASEPAIGLGLDCDAVLAACVSYGIAEEECLAVKAECEADVATGENAIQLK